MILYFIIEDLKILFTEKLSQTLKTPSVSALGVLACRIGHSYFYFVNSFTISGNPIKCDAFTSTVSPLCTSLTRSLIRSALSS